MSADTHTSTQNRPGLANVRDAEIARGARPPGARPARDRVALAHAERPDTPWRSVGPFGCFRSGRHDVEVERGRNLLVEANRDAVRPDGLDRRTDLDTTLVDVRTAGGLDGRDDVRDGDGAEEPARVAGARLERHLETRELTLDLGGLVERADLARLAGATDGRHVLLAAAAPANRVAAGDE